ncbi:hypothetical protein Leryth_020206 [Lithospermum erythrorhizon]|nr:hypothetical protein Leryth_020206 [Lithospermum erythrorhizon]
MVVEEYEQSCEEALRSVGVRSFRQPTHGVVRKALWRPPWRCGVAWRGGRPGSHEWFGGEYVRRLYASSFKPCKRRRRRHVSHRFYSENGVWGWLSRLYRNYESSQLRQHPEYRESQDSEAILVKGGLMTSEAMKIGR